ncbi:uncharacterized protein At4g26450 isoform X2 [Prosopis cineraria]|uniref:uncharacterized protein At4g26450 isoform X2 n=1 Tax=Prosopis cineraria TaxID=364024 RepID=UPI00240FAB7F|nr:uncharacterized protein At4g26450 isoform X2 [Prosopis cineraria]
MHARQRSPGNGYRSGSMGMGMNLAESSIRGGHGFYGNRDSGFGRGHGNPKTFAHTSQPPFRKGDIFMEAGRLAAEYLVSQGLLPPSTLPVKWHNSSFKKHSSEFRAQDGDAPQLPAEGRTSVLARLGSSVSDTSSGRRRFGVDDFKDKVRRRGGSFRSNGFDWGRDFKRSGSWSDRPRVSPERKDNDDTVAKPHDEEQQQQAVGTDNVLQTSNSTGFVPKCEDGGDLDAGIDKEPGSSETELKAGPSTAANNKYNMEREPIKASNNLDNISAGGKELKDSTCDDDIEKPSISNNFSISLTGQESNTSSRVCTDLLTLCKSVKVPTKTRSSLTCKGLKVDPLRNNGNEKTHNSVCLQGPEISPEESVKGSSSVDLQSDKTSDSKHLDSEVTKVQSVYAADNIRDLHATCNVEQVTSVSSESCEDRAHLNSNNLESSPRLPEYGSSISMIEERGEKRAANADDGREETKKLKEWLPSFVPRTKDYFLHGKAIEKNPVEDEISPLDNATLKTDHGSLMSNPQFIQGGNRPFLQCSEEKQSLSSSFRTCDLNLIETSELHDNHEDDPILIYPSISETKKGTEPVDIDLSISHASVSSGFSTCATGSKEIEIIDLESDSVQEGRPADIKDRKTEAMFAGLEGFSNHAQNAGELHDVQDGGYGLMLSELLGSDFPNCSSVPGDMNSVHNEIGLHNGPGTLGEDDSIYMTLGEIPLSSFLQNWEQPPPQDYEKHF